MSASDPAREWRAYSFRTAAVGAGGLGTLLKGNSSPKAVGAPQGSPPSLHLPLPPIERARLRCLRSEEALSTHAPSRLFGLAAFAADADATGWKSDPAPPIGAALCWLEPCRARAVPAVSWVRASHAQHRAGPGGNSGARRDCARPDTGTRDPPAHCPSVLAQRAVTLE